MADKLPPLPVDFDPFATDGTAPAPAELLPLTVQQREMYAVTLMGEAASCAYNQCFVLRLSGPLSHESLCAALSLVVQRHAALRASVVDDEQQAIAAEVAAAMPLVDLSSLPAAERETAIAKLLEQETHAPFDLHTAPLWRARLVRESAEQHRLVFTAHHLILDGWSSAVVFGDLARAYAADRFGVLPSLPPAAAYRDFVADGRGPAVLAEAQDAEDFWAQQYAGGVPAFELPFDRPRPAFKTYAAARETLRVDAALYQSVRKMGAQQGATLFVTLLAAYEAFLSRLSGSNELVIGVPMASQALQENGHLVAHGVNTVPVLAKVDQQQSFTEHLRATRRRFLDAQAHQRLTFGSLVQRLRLPRDPSRTPLVSVIFNIDKLGAAFDFGAPVVTGVENPKAFHNFEFGINAVDDGSSLLLECDYNSDLLTASTVRRWLGYYRELLAAAAADPAARVAELPLLSPPEVQALLAAASSARRHPRTAPLHQRFEEQAARTPDAVALTSFDGEVREEMSYAQLNRRANAVATRLHELGVTANQLVGLRTHRNAHVVVGILAILKAGGAYLPLDPVYPRDRVAFMLEDAGVAVILTQSDLRADLDGLGGTVLCLDQFPAGGADDTNLPAVNAPDDLAYVIYTSGSTGQPKGVRITHHNVSRLFAATQERFGFDARDVWTLFHSYAFDFSVWEIWGALLYGGRVVAVSSEIGRNAEALRELLVRERVTVLNQTPSAFRQLIDVDRGKPAADFALRYVIFGGEALELQSLKPWFERHGDSRPRLVNMYGITETTVHVTYRELTQADLAGHAGSVIGAPIDDLRVYVLDAHRRLVPPGVPGEMYVSGAGVAAGYLNRPELTAERFLPDPFSDEPHARMYRTGDLARRLGGELEYLGRIDQQVKIRGFRIELGEIESVIAQYPGIRQVAVIDREDVPGEKTLAAYLVADAPDDALLDSLRERLRQALPDYMRPAHFTFVGALPLTNNGKLDRAALPRPGGARDRRADLVAPRNATEVLVAATFEEILNRSPIGIHDNFFDLGGHSLMAARVMAKLRAKAGIDLPLRNLFERPTPESLAAAIDALTWATKSLAPAPAAGAREEIEL